jgi:hypothetical protein
MIIVLQTLWLRKESFVTNIFSAGSGAGWAVALRLQDVFGMCYLALLKRQSTYLAQNVLFSIAFNIVESKLCIF